MDSKQKGYSQKQSGFDRFSAWFFTSLKNGLFGYLFTSYDKENELYLKKANKVKDKDYERRRGKARRRVAALIEKSVFANAVPAIPDFLLRVSTRDYALIFFIMGLLTTVLYPVRQYLTLIDISFETFISGIIVCVCCVPLFFSAQSVSKDVMSSKITRGIIFDFLGIREEKFRAASEKKKFTSPNISFFVGLLLGVGSYFITPFKILGIIAILIVAYEVLTVPEVGMILIIFSAPFLNMYALAASTVYVFICYILKCIVGKRTFKFEYFDLWTSIFIVVLICGGFISSDIRSSAKAMAVCISLSLSYFIVVNLIRSKEWYARGLVSAMVSTLVVSIVAIFQAVMGKISEFVPDASFFSTPGENISSVFSSSVVFAEYLMITIPIIVTYMITKRERSSKFAAFLLCVISMVSLLLTRSSEGILGCIVAVMLLLLIYHRNYIYLLITMCIGLPVIFLAMPMAAKQSFIDFLGFSDISPSAKLPVLRSAFEMIKSHPFGVGLGNGASDMGSLYFKLAAELGVIGLVIFLAFMLVFAKLSFTYCAKSKNRFRKISCCVGFCSVVGALAAGTVDCVFADKSVLLMFIISIGMSFAYIKIERDEEAPKSLSVDIASASVDIILSNDTTNAVPKRKYVHAPKARKERKINEEDMVKEFYNGDDLIKVVTDAESEAKENDK